MRIIFVLILLLFSACDSSERLIAKCADYSYEKEKMSFKEFKENNYYVPKKLKKDTEEHVKNVLNLPFKQRMHIPSYARHFTICELEYRSAPSAFKIKW